MSNMSYCRFQNTLGDLIDCKDALEGIMVGCDGDGETPTALSRDELSAAKMLVQTCFELIGLVGDHLPGNSILDTEEADLFDNHYSEVIEKANAALDS